VAVIVAVAVDVPVIVDRWRAPEREPYRGRDRSPL